MTVFGFASTTSRRKSTDNRDNLDVAEDAADHFKVHNDEIGAPYLDAQEIELANDEQVREPEAENDAEKQLQDVNKLSLPAMDAVCITVDDGPT